MRRARAGQTFPPEHTRHSRPHKGTACVAVIVVGIHRIPGQVRPQFALPFGCHTRAGGYGLGNWLLHKFSVIARICAQDFHTSQVIQVISFGSHSLAKTEVCGMPLRCGSHIPLHPLVTVYKVQICIPPLSDGMRILGMG